MKKPLDETIPLEQAWQQGRRVYARCGYKSRLNTALRRLGAHWDGEEKALWVGSTKREAVRGLVLEHRQLMERAEKIKALGLWVTIPRNAVQIRTEANTRGCIYDAERRAWAAPTPEVQALLKHALVEHERGQKEEQVRQRERRERLKVAKDTLMAMSPTELAERVGYTLTGQTEQYRWVSTDYMTRAIAEEQLDPVGTVVELKDGRYGIVTEHRAWFTGSEMASSVCWHNETCDAAHWDLWHRVAVARQTPPAKEENHDPQEYARDASTLHTFVENLRTDQTAALEGYTALGRERPLGTIDVAYTPGEGPFRVGDSVLLLPDRILYRRPGHKSGLSAREKTITSPDLVEQMRALIDEGERVRLWEDRLHYRYKVTSYTSDPEH